MQDWIRWLLTVPLTGALLTGLNLLLPLSRWSWRMKRNSSLAQTLAAGDERAWFEQRVREDARRIIDYKTLLPRSEKVLCGLGVLFVVYFISVLILNPSGLIAELGAEGPSIWVMSALVLLFVVPATIGAFTGRSSRVMTPQHYANAGEREATRIRKQQVRMQARRRARHVRRLQPKS
ncbi:hypothetical protein [Amnibacterium endophyticum]|uniref:DUF106 domain-containing protein n=1 Tax=Amnibacterium endophyticum TaxID=2109337 RepID=A0ABW4LJ03_9MICO